MEKHPIHNPRLISRRNVLGGIGSAAALGVMAREGMNYNSEDDEVPPEEIDLHDDEEEIEEGTFEQIAEDLPSPVFEKVLNARIIEAGGLRRDQVVFIDTYGRQITQVFNLTVSVKLTPEEMTWRYKGGKPAGIPGTWTNIHKEYISRKTGIPESEIEMLHVYQDLDNESQANFESRIEMVYHNATTVVPEDVYGRDAITIIREESQFSHIPEDVSSFLLPHLIGIAAEESRFDASKTSAEGAIGFVQTMPWVFEAYKKKHKLPDLDPRNLIDQLPVGLNHIEVSYLELVEKLDLELANITNLYFNGNFASMKKYFLVPIIINSYNAGQDRMIDVVQWFLENYPDPESVAELIPGGTQPTGYDVFFTMTHQCALENGVKDFGSKASTYVAKVMGWTEAYEDYEQKRKGIQIASN